MSHSLLARQDTQANEELNGATVADFVGSFQCLQAVFLHVGQHQHVFVDAPISHTKIHVKACRYVLIDRTEGAHGLAAFHWGGKLKDSG